MENEEQKNEYPGSKVGDFFLGLVLNILIGVIIPSVSGLFSWIDSSVLPIFLEVITFIVAEIFIGSYFAKRDRKYVIIGMVSSIALPLLLFGPCLLLFGN